MPRSLRGELLGWLLIPLAGVVAFNAWTTHRSAVATANLITDRTLLASARVIAEQVKDNEGSVEALIPPSALEMFASPDRDHVIYRVMAPSGELIAGFPDVAIPPRPPVDLQPVHFEARFRVEDIRAVAISQPVVSKSAGGNALVVVGTSLHGRDRLVTELWLRSLRDQTLLVGIAALLALFGLHRGLAPLLRLRSELVARDPGSLQPLAGENLQTELKPLIDALNHAFARIQTYITLQRRFVADASHQLRTPLAVLKTQATVGLRDSEAAAKTEALAAIDGGLDAMARVVNQLLVLARAEPGGAAMRKEAVDFAAITRAALESRAMLAFDRRIDLSFEGDQAGLELQGHVTLLREMVANLVENALRYTPEGGAVSVRLTRQPDEIHLSIEDNGPGIPEAERERVFERFYRLASGSEGTGLGLAIVREIVSAHGGRITLSQRTPPPGLHAQIILPASFILPAS
ncbi:sensor histidine kinase N-terminal domain-containing protein [Bosea sp. LjRoot9]|uniref:sensor histidine kinase N-terminal domain-containing protein n=1 Tax=Bosea sp. LjRoot9 TaxID=3342341 RepID=UPI003ECD9506